MTTVYELVISTPVERITTICPTEADAVTALIEFCRSNWAVAFNYLWELEE